MMTGRTIGAAVLLAIIAWTPPAFAAPAPVATYRFEDSLAAEEPGVPALVAVDPLGLNGFVTADVFGRSRRVLRLDGNASPATQQAGLFLDASGLVAATSYTVELVFQFVERDGSWRRILDVENRGSDNGFYVSPSNRLHVFPVTEGSTVFTNNVFHHVVLSNSGGTVKAYLDGVRQFTTETAVMNVSNPGMRLNFFLDNTAAGGQGEFADAVVALIRVYGVALDDAEVAALAVEPLGDADLGVTITASPAMAAAGRRATYTVHVNNHGSVPASDVILAVVLPDGAGFFSASATSGSCDHADGVVTCALGDLADGGAVDTTIVAIPTVAGDATLTATVAAADVDSNPDDNTASVVTVVTDRPPATPTGLAATMSARGILLTWNGASSDESGFELERRSAGRFARIGSVGPGVTAFEDRGIAPNRTYAYRVRALNPSGASPYAGDVSIRAAFGRLVVRQRTVTFFERVGAVRTAAVVIQNAGTGSLTGTVGGLGVPFAIIAGEGEFTIAPGGTRVVTVRFAPTARGPASATLVITGATPAPVTVEVRVMGTAR